MITVNTKKALLSGHGPMQLSIDLEIPAGELLAISGPSGSGKSSLLRILAGLLPPEEGHMVVDGECWLDTSRGINWPARKRNIGLVFQDYALFPHFTVHQNLRYALQKDQPAGHLEDLVRVMELQQLLDRKPGHLSGGQQQRVALARALVRRPKLLLLDEPLSALDPDMRSRLQAYILRVHQTFGLTTVMVSHDRRETDRMADRILLMKNGQLEPVAGAPQNCGGASVQLKGRVVSWQLCPGHYLLQVELGGQSITLNIPLQSGPFQVGQEVLLESDQWQLTNSWR